MELTVIQTSDSKKYNNIIKATSRVVALYCHLHSYNYLKYVGLKRGNSAVHAAFNRVFMLNELLESGYRGWVLYLDADAYISNLTFDAIKYLQENQTHAFIAAKASDKVAEKWAINNGVFFINLGNKIGEKIARMYLHYVNTLVPQEYWQRESAEWPPAEYDDQNILYGILSQSDDILESIKKEMFAFNTGHADEFISQAIRAGYSSFEDRELNIQKTCDEIINKFIISTNAFLTKD